MTRRILILTEPRDAHAVAVAEALKHKGAEVILWQTSDFPTRAGETVLFEKQTGRVHIQGPGLDLVDPRFDTVWRRRPCYVLGEDTLHPADRDFADAQCKDFRQSLFAVLCPEAFWVNPHEAAGRANHKLLQHRAARDVGLSMPDTLYGNDPRQVRAFLRQHGGRAAYKPLRGLPWRDENTYWVNFTNVIAEEHLIEDELLRLTPGIYQEVVDKAYELRVTILGRRALGAKVLSQETASGRLDWRRSGHELRMEPFPVPPPLAERCVALLRRLGLVFGCLDFVVTPDGEYVFLEVNEMGQFLFVEYGAGLPLLDAFTEFLLQGRVDFAWDEERVKVRLVDVEKAIEDMASRPSERHVARPAASSWEGRAKGREGAATLERL